MKNDETESLKKLDAMYMNVDKKIKLLQKNEKLFDDFTHKIFDKLHNNPDSFKDFDNLLRRLDESKVKRNEKLINLILYSERLLECYQFYQSFFYKSGGIVIGDTLTSDTDDVDIDEPF